MATVARTRRAARIDDYTDAGRARSHEAARGAGFQSAIGAPITVEGRLWGVIIAISTDPEPIPERSEARLGQFTELVATAVANAEARDALAQLADEQAALRRVATLVAQGVEPEAIFSAVGEEIGRPVRLGAHAGRPVRARPAGARRGRRGRRRRQASRSGSRWELDEVPGLGRGLPHRAFRSRRRHGLVGVRGPVAEVGRRSASSRRLRARSSSRGVCGA